MCGIAGLVRTDGGAVDVGVLGKMTTLLRHRGPDDEGYLLGRFPSGPAVAAVGTDTVAPLRSSLPQITAVDATPQSLGLGHRRLSIIDCTSAGHQPMHDASGDLWIVYNGEIYNYIELRDDLAQRGHVFHTRSDTEVLLAAYATWGPECLQRLNGMWAFCVWDRRRGELFCARDRFGVKPFYYRWTDSTFAFASEIKALLPTFDTPPKVNDAIAYDYLQLGLLEHTSETMITSIHQLPAGHTLTLRPDGLTVHRYYTLSCSTESRLPRDADIEAMGATYRGLLTDAVRLRLRTDVPLGSCLSGGLDSSSIVCALSEILRATGTATAQRTFTATYDDPTVDERRFAEIVVAAAGVDAQWVFPSAAGLWDELTALTWHQDEPFGSTSIYAQWCVMRAAHNNGVTVMLDGQAGDELLGGYLVYYPIFLKQLLLRGRWVAYKRELLAAKTWSRRPPHRLFFRSLAAFYDPIRLLLPPHTRGTDLLASDFARRHRHRHPHWRRRHSIANVQHRMWTDLTQFNLPQLLRYEDRNSMAFSVEARLPFMDYRLVEWAFAQPLTAKLHNGWTKYVARRGIVDLCPADIVWRKDKIGFATPEARWMKAGEEIFRTLSEPSTFHARGFLDPIKLRAQLLPNDNLTTQWRPELWRALNFELWMRVFGLSGE